MTNPSDGADADLPAGGAASPAGSPARPRLDLAALTPARVALGRAGSGLPTRAALAFGLDHARARDAIHAPFDAEAIAAALSGLGLEALRASSRAGTRETYLRRPDLGRRLALADAAALAQGPRATDLALVVADGLSATAVHAHAVPLVAALLPILGAARVSLGPAVVVTHGRVAVGDEIGALLGARAVAVLIGERPGLSAPDSLGVYLAFAPRLGRSDAERNCLSNIRAAGLAPREAAGKLAWLVGEALRRGVTGVALKDESGASAPRLASDIGSET